MTAAAHPHRKIVLKLCALVLGMCGFVVLLVPLYYLLCDLTGLGGRTGGQYTYTEAEATPDTSRLIRINFVTNTQNMPWEFWAEKGGVRVHPGEVKTVNFFVKNTSNKVMVGQAVPSVVPLMAVDHFHKTECFCFEQQILQPGETMEMPMRFIVGKELPEVVGSINLSYALFDITALTDTAQLEQQDETATPSRG